MRDFLACRAARGAGTLPCAYGAADSAACKFKGMSMCELCRAVQKSVYQKAACKAARGAGSGRLAGASDDAGLDRQTDAAAAAAIAAAAASTP